MNSKNCPCCYRYNLKKIYDSSFFKTPVMKCLDCSHYFTEILSTNQLDDYTASFWKTYRPINDKGVYAGKLPKASFFKKLWAMFNFFTNVESARSISQYDFIKPILKGNNMLEIGSGQGFTLKFFENKGFNVHGIEPSKEICEFINKKLKRGSCDVGKIENISIEKSFDLIIMSHVLEHLLNPREVLLRLKSNLNKDGILFIEVPNCISGNLLGSINNSPHIQHFTKYSLTKLMKDIDFEVIAVDIFSAIPLISITDYLMFSLKWIFKNEAYYQNPSGAYLRMIVKST